MFTETFGCHDDHCLCHSGFTHLQWRVQTFLKGAPTPKVGVVTYYFATVLPKTPGGASLDSPLDLPMICMEKKREKLHRKLLAFCTHKCVVFTPVYSFNLSISLSAILWASEVIQQKGSVDAHWNSHLFHGSHHPNSDLNIVRRYP